MRPIKFRGKRVDTKEWVYGYLIELWTPKGKKQRYAIDMSEDYDLDGNSIDIYQVIPETVGQFIGLCDKNGKEVYEGDVLLDKESFCKIIVEWMEFFSSGEMILGYGIGFNIHKQDLDYGYIVIGNIFDNPELVEGVK